MRRSVRSQRTGTLSSDPDILRFVEGIERALALGGNTHTFGDVVHQILEGRAQLWMDEDALIVTEVHEAPRVRTLHFWIATGKLLPVVALSKKAMEWGRSIGCTRATLAGRRGWTRALAREGWTPELTVMGRPI